MNKFISKAMQKAIEEEKLQNEKILDAAYEAANRDADRLETLQEWNTLDDVSDLVKEDEDWDWLRYTETTSKLGILTRRRPEFESGKAGEEAAQPE